MDAVTAGGQVIIPQSILAMLDIGPSSRVELVVNRDCQIGLRKAGPKQPLPFDRVVGSAVRV
jgi:bifunctional DNA-binding transcriptional regulator/antitoxin component of YhaV-PrlF toxin-antitoxin module